MGIDRHYPQRKSPRLQGYDYRSAGAYFVTICTHERYQHFGSIVDRVMQLNAIGRIAANRWAEIPSHFSNVALDHYVVMPNHVHGILLLLDKTSVKHPALGTIIGNYKAVVSREANRSTWIETIRLWQGRYHDHIIRDEQSLHQIRDYIIHNPAHWEEDRFYVEKM